MSTIKISRPQFSWSRPSAKTILSYAALTFIFVLMIGAAKHTKDETNVATDNVMTAVHIHLASLDGSMSRAGAREELSKLFSLPGGGMAVALSLKALEKDGDIKARDKLFIKYLSELPDVERRFLLDGFEMENAFSPSFKTTLSESDMAFASLCLGATPNIKDNAIGVAKYVYVSLFKTHASKCMRDVSI